MKKFFSIILLVFSFLIVTQSVKAASLSLSPSSVSVSAGQTITVNIKLDTSGAAIDGVDVYSLHYDPSILEVQDANSGTSGIQIQSGSLLPITLTNIVSGGLIKFSQVSSGGTSYTGSGVLATITFKGIANGTSAVTFDFTPGSTSDSNVAGGGQDKLSSVGNGSYTVTNGSTPDTSVPNTTPQVDTTNPPDITNVNYSNVNSTSVSILWTTDTISDSRVEYGVTASYGSATSLNSSLVTLHSQVLTGLNPNTTYHFRVKSKDSSGNISYSNDDTFKTAPSGTTVSSNAPSTSNTSQTSSKTNISSPKPQYSVYTAVSTVTNTKKAKVSEVYAYATSISSANVSWLTDDISDSQVQYGTTDSYGSSTDLDSNYVLSHSQILSNLSPETIYHYRVRSENKLGNVTFSPDQTFITLKIINKTLIQRFFDWLIAKLGLI